jgi:hypothetical protein
MQSVVFAAALFLAAQSTPQFSGTWIAAHSGDTFVRLELHEINGALGGRISLGAMHVDKDGVVDEVLRPAVNFTPIFDVLLRDGVLSFARKDEDDTDRFELRLVGDTAELRFLVTPAFAEELARDGIPIPKPVPLQRSPR